MTARPRKPSAADRAIMGLREFRDRLKRGETITSIGGLVVRAARPRRPAKRKPSDEKLANQIARHLFTNGQNERGTQLRMVDATGKYLGGWSEYAVASYIANAIAAQSQATP